MIPTGVRIESINWDVVPDDMVPELQLRGLASLAFRGLLLANGMTTIDADYHDDICVLLMNWQHLPCQINEGDYIAHMCEQYVVRMDLPLVVGDEDEAV